METLWENRVNLIGKVITVRSKVVISESCNMSYCPMRCCSNCTGAYTLAKEELSPTTNYVRIDFTNTSETERKKYYFGCFGGQCSMECSPFKPGDTYVIQGILKENNYEGFSTDPENDRFLFEYLGSV